MSQYTDTTSGASCITFNAQLNASGAPVTAKKHVVVSGDQLAKAIDILDYADVFAIAVNHQTWFVQCCVCQPFRGCVGAGIVAEATASGRNLISL
jgi:hypothetical protein